MDTSGDSMDVAIGADMAVDTAAPDAEPNEGDFCPVEDFEACAGDVVGTWRVRSLCPDDPAAAAALFESPYDDREECVGGGNSTIGHSEVDGLFELASDGAVMFEMTTTIRMEWVFDDTCLAAAPLRGATAEERCADVANERVTCSYTPDACHCESDEIVQPESGSGTYTIDGDEIQFGDDPPARYCVDGDRLVMDYYLYHPVSWRYWVFERE